MKTKKRISICLTFLMFTYAFQINAKEIYKTADSTRQEKVYYAIEINSVLCGYMEITESPIKRDGKELIQGDLNIFAMLSVLGSEFNQEIKIKSLVELASRKCVTLTTSIDQGSVKYNFEIAIKKDTAFIKSLLQPLVRKIFITPETVTGNDEFYMRIKNDFLEKRITEKSYDIIELIEGKIQRSTVKKIGEEKLELVGKAYNTILIETTNNKTGLKTKYWLSPELDYFLQFEIQNRKIYLTDHSVIDKIKVSNMDSHFFTKSNLAISDLQAISYMKLKVRLEPTGITLQKSNLNVPGQKFEGTVNDNVVEGIFEITHKKYNGDNAPSFPQVYKEDKFKKYLEPTSFIESNDPVLVAKAKEITSGAKDSWEATKQISKWVAENIGYAIPGGGTARRTYDIRAGECGSHSMLLAAFCRAVGIPVRIVFGAMYTPNFGGGFGQHGWNEVYMGDAGWIPIDATAHEIDFVDSGHIRISEMESVSSHSFGGKKIEILDYELGDKNLQLAIANTMDFPKYFGKYTNLESSRTFTVLEKEGNLSVDVGQNVLPFNTPNENGRLICKLAPHLSIQFNLDENGNTTDMILYQSFLLPKKSEAENIDADVSEEKIPYLGKYYFSAINAELTILTKDKSLAVYDPKNNTTVKLQNTGKEGRWIDEHNKNTVYFEKDPNGNVNGIKLEAANKFLRGELASNIIEKIIVSDGIESGIKKYEDLKQTKDDKIIFTEHSLNLLAYKYLNASKINEALTIFKLIVREYPGSFNAYGCLAEALLKNNQKEEAIINFKKSIGLNPKNETAKKRLEELGVML